MDNYHIKICKSSELTEKNINDFLSVHQAVFHQSELDIKWFKRKYIDNPYGDSFLAYAYSDNGNVAAVRAFWRNDLGNQIAFQPADTCTMPEHRRRGLFAQLTKAVLNQIPSNVYIYNFPNDNSYPQYLKLGWHLHSQLHVRFYSEKDYFTEYSYPIDDKYLTWWILPTTKKKLSVCWKDDHAFLVYPSGAIKRYYILGDISKEIANEFNVCHPLILTYASRYYTWYNKNRNMAGRIAVYNVPDEVSIPLWKLDFI